MLFIVKKRFYKFFVFVYSVEERLDVDFALSTRKIGIDLNESTRQLLGVQALRMEGRTIIKE